MSAHIKELFGKAEISERTVWRLLEADSWPTRDAVEKLSEVFPELAWAMAESDTLRGGWNVAWIDQQRLQDRSTITILAAAEDPKALGNRGIAESLAHNILVKGCRYVFLFPPFPEHDLPSVRVRLAGAVLTEVGQLTQKNPTLEIGVPDTWYPRILNSIFLFRTRKTSESWEMWGKTPNYAVLYNACSPDPEDYPKYGMYWTKGVSIYSSPLTSEPERVSGWEFLDPSDSDDLFNFIESSNGGVVDEQDFAHWPIPGRNS